MPSCFRFAPVALLLIVSATARVAGARENGPPPALHGLDPDMLSPATFAALEAQGAFGAVPVPRAAAAYPNLSKGRPGAVLDARVGLNVRLGDDPPELPAAQRGQAEPHIYRSAANPDVLLACFQEGRFAADGGAVSCGYALSRDGGLTWTRALVPRLTIANGGPYRRATDPVAAIGPQGDLYLNNLVSVDDAFGLAGVVVSRSTDNGVTWSDPITIFQSSTTQVFPDKNWFAVNDLPGAPNSGRLVATWTSFTRTATGQQTGNNIVAALSDDRGTSWTAPIPVTPAGSNNQGSQPLFLPDGSLGIVYITFLGSTTQFGINFKRSLDGGRTFPANATTVVGFVSGWDDPEMRDGVFLPSAAVARTSGEIVVTFTSLLAGTPRVMFTRSADQGATWSPPVAVSDNPAGGSVMNPTVAISPDGRNVAIVFMDKRRAPEGRGFVDHFVALSFDGGATWQPSVRLTQLSSDIRFGPPTTRGVMLGDYLGVAPAFTPEQPFVAVWCDTRTGDSDPFAVRFTASPTADYDAWAIARGVVPARFLPLDTDGDRVMDQVEYLTGTDPRRAESGEPFVISRSSATTLDIAWAQRAEPSGPSVGVAVFETVRREFGSQGFHPVPGSPLPPDRLPPVEPREGLVWRGIRETIPAGAPRGVGFGVRFSAGFGLAYVASPVAAVNTDARLINLSTRGAVAGGGGDLIVGFVTEGGKSVLVRAAGPALAEFNVTGALADPRLQFQSFGSEVVLTNDDWQQSTNAALVPATPALFTRLGAFPFASNSRDAALVLALGRGAHTAIVSGVANAAGVALVEAYDADAAPGAPANPRLLNLSTRGNVGTGQNALVAGFVLGGSEPRRVLLRAIGPALGAFGLTGVVADPMLVLFRGDVVVAQNDDWEITRSRAALAATAHRVGAFPLNAGSLDAALLLTLEPGGYTAVVTSADGTSGVALVEIYDVD